MVWDILRLGSMSGTDQARICENSVCLARKDVGRNAGSIKIVKSEVLVKQQDREPEVLDVSGEDHLLITFELNEGETRSSKYSIRSGARAYRLQPV
jgi:hypothetical protein